MSGSDAKTPEVAKVIGIFGSLGSQGERDEKQSHTTEVEVKERSTPVEDSPSVPDDDDDDVEWSGASDDEDSSNSEETELTEVKSEHFSISFVAGEKMMMVHLKKGQKADEKFVKKYLKGLEIAYKSIKNENEASNSNTHGIVEPKKADKPGKKGTKNPLKLKLEDSDENEIASHSSQKLEDITSKKIGSSKNSVTVTSSSKIEEDVADNDSEGDKDEDEPTSDIESLFGPDSNLNEDVIAVIFQFLDYEDLKLLRQVNKVWSARATPEFVRNSKVVLESGTTRDDDEEMKELEVAAKKLDLSGLSAIEITLYEEIGFEKEAELFNDILQKLSPTLETFELNRLPKKLYFLPRATIQFPVLTTITLTDNYSQDEELNRRFFALFYASAHNLTELIIYGVNSSVLSPLLADDESRNWSLAPKLKSLSVAVSLSTESLSTLVNFPQNTWESLEFSKVCDTVAVGLLSQLLEKNSDSLFSLKLAVDIDELRTPATLNFPTTFSKLEQLELKIRFWRVAPSPFNFGPNPINYSKTFPSLSALKVHLFLNDTEDRARLWKFLFPPQVFKGLQDLELYFGQYYPRFLRKHGIAEDWAAVMFPNAELEII